MSTSKIINDFLDAMELIADKAASGGDVTVDMEVTDKNNNVYTLKCPGVDDPYTVSSQAKYEIGDRVYVLCRGGVSGSEGKVILSKVVEPGEEEQAPAPEYIEQGQNVLTLDEQSLTLTTNQEISSTINQDAFVAYVKIHKYLQLSAKFKTNFDDGFYTQEEDFQNCNFGLKAILDFGAEGTKELIIDTNDMQGFPWDQDGTIITKKIEFFEDISKFNGLKKLEFFVDNEFLTNDSSITVSEISLITVLPAGNITSPIARVVNLSDDLTIESSTDSVKLYTVVSAPSAHINTLYKWQREGKDGWETEEDAIAVLQIQEADVPAKKTRFKSICTIGESVFEEVIEVKNNNGIEVSGTREVNNHIVTYTIGVAPSTGVTYQWDKISYAGIKETNFSKAQTIQVDASNVDIREEYQGHVYLNGIYLGSTERYAIYQRLKDGVSFDHIEEYYRAFESEEYIPKEESEFEKREGFNDPQLKDAWKSSVAATQYSEQYPYLWNIEKVVASNGTYEWSGFEQSAVWGKNGREEIDRKSYYAIGDSESSAPSGGDAFSETDGDVNLPNGWEAAWPNLIQGQSVWEVEGIKYNKPDSNEKYWRFSAPQLVTYMARDGVDESGVSLTISSLVFKQQQDSTITPAIIHIERNVFGEVTTNSGDGWEFEWQWSDDNSSWNDIDIDSTQNIYQTSDNDDVYIKSEAAANQLYIKLTATKNSTSYYDQCMITKLVDGTNGTSPVTAIWSNPLMVFSGDENGVVEANEFESSTLHVYEGINEVSPTTFSKVSDDTNLTVNGFQVTYTVPTGGSNFGSSGNINGSFNFTFKYKNKDYPISLPWAKTAKGAKGDPGAGAILLTLTNDSTQITTDADGDLNLEEGKSLLVETTAQISDHGQTDDWKYSISPTSGTGFSAAIDVTYTNKALITLNNNFSNIDAIEFTLTASSEKLDLSLSKVFTITKNKTGADGAPAVVYELSVSPNQWNKADQATITPTMIVTKTVGNTTTKVENGYIIKISDTVWDGTAISTTTTFDLYVDDVKVDSETVSMVDNGNDGAPAVTISLSNASGELVTDADGNNGTYGTDALKTTVSVFEGGKDISNQFTYSQTWTNIQGTGNESSRTFETKTGSLTADSGSVKFFATPKEGYEDKYSAQEIVFIVNKKKQGPAGYNGATIALYKRASNAPSAGPSGTLTYNFSNKALTPDTNFNGWSTSIPAMGTESCYAIYAFASSNTNEDTIEPTEWTKPMIIEGVNGAPGINTATVFLYQRSSSIPTMLPGTITYTFADGNIEGALNGWETIVPAANGNPCYVIQAVAVSSDTSDTIDNWSSPVVYTQDGEAGKYKQYLYCSTNYSTLVPDVPQKSGDNPTYEGTELPDALPWNELPTEISSSRKYRWRSEKYNIETEDYSVPILDTNYATNGTSATIYWIEVSPEKIRKAIDGSLVDTSLQVTLKYRIGSGNAYNYNGYWRIYWNDTDFTNMQGINGGAASFTIQLNSHKEKITTNKIIVKVGTTANLSSILASKEIPVEYVPEEMYLYYGTNTVNPDLIPPSYTGGTLPIDGWDITIPSYKYVYRSSQTIINGIISATGWSKPALIMENGVAITTGRAQFLELSNGGDELGIFTVETKQDEEDENKTIEYLGINASYIQTGALRVQDKNENVLFEADTGKKADGTSTTPKVNIAGFDVTDSYILNGTKGSLGSVYLGTDSISLGTNFKVTNKGKMRANDGIIGNFQITNNYLQSSEGNFKIYGENYSKFEPSLVNSDATSFIRLAIENLSASHIVTLLYQFFSNYTLTDSAESTIDDHIAAYIANTVADDAESRELGFISVPLQNIEVPCKVWEKTGSSSISKEKGILEIKIPKIQGFSLATLDEGINITLSNGEIVSTQSNDSASSLFLANEDEDYYYYKNSYWFSDNSFAQQYIGDTSVEDIQINSSIFISQATVGLVAGTVSQLLYRGNNADYVSFEDMGDQINVNASIPYPSKNFNGYNFYVLSQNNLYQGLSTQTEFNLIQIKENKTLSNKIAPTYLLGDGSFYINAIKVNADATVKGTLYTTSGSVSKSDRNSKNSIQLLSNPYEQIFNAIQPVSHKYNDGTSNRTHIGVIAQDVEQAVLDAGLTTQDFAAVCYDIDKETGEKKNYGIRYTEFVPLNIWQIQKLKTRVFNLEEENRYIKQKLEELESRL